jgi:hypothetical protein
MSSLRKRVTADRRPLALAILGVAALLGGGAVAALTQAPDTPPTAVSDSTSSQAVAASASLAARPSDAPSSSPGSSPAASEDPASNFDTEAVPEDPDLPTDWPARVTKAGDGLRVRTRPGLGDDSKPISPLLDAGTRVLVLDGPVRADGFDWYQVMTYSRDERLTDWAGNSEYLFGWVAARKGDRTWLEYEPLQCEDEPTQDHVMTMPPAEFLACFGSEPVAVVGRVNDGLGPLSEGGTEEDIACPDLSGPDRCDLRVPWLQIPLGSIFFPELDEAGTLPVALQPPVEEAFYAVQSNDRVVFTISMDAHESGDCRVVDTRTGKNYITRDEAVARCRLNFVLRDVHP